MWLPFIQSLLAVPILRASHGECRWFSFLFGLELINICRSAVFSLDLGSTVSMGLSIAFHVTARLAWQISNRRLDGRWVHWAQLALASFSSQPLPQRWSTQSPGWCPALPETHWWFHSIPKETLILKSLNPVISGKVSEPTYFVTYDIGFKRETYFDGAFGVLKKVKVLLKNWDCNS